MFEEELQVARLERRCFMHGALMMRREALLAVGGYRRAFPVCEDVDLWLRLTEGRSVANLPEVLYLYRVDDHNVTARHDQLRVHYDQIARGLARQRAGPNGSPLLTKDSGPQTDINLIALPKGDTYLFAGANDIGAKSSWTFAAMTKRRPGLSVGGGVLYSRLGARAVGLTAGASAPEILVEEVVEACRERYDVAIEEVAVTREEVRFNLPRALIA